VAEAHSQGVPAPPPLREQPGPRFQPRVPSGKGLGNPVRGLRPGGRHPHHAAPAQARPARRQHLHGLGRRLSIHEAARMTPAWVKALALPLAVFSALFGAAMVAGAVALIDGVTAEHSYMQTAELAPGGTVSLEIPRGGVKIFP